MTESLFPNKDDNAMYFSRADESELLGTFSEHSFILEDKEWPSAEHYFQAMKFESSAAQEKIRLAQTAKHARKLGRSRFNRLRKDWAQVKKVYMTRALYTKCRAHEAVAQALLATENLRLVENSQYDYFWGCGRDRRGENNYGEVLMNIREKLKEDIS